MADSNKNQSFQQQSNSAIASSYTNAQTSGMQATGMQGQQNQSAAGQNIQGNNAGAAQGANSTMTSATQSGQAVSGTAQSVVGVFKSRDNAEKAVQQLRQQGFTTEEINLVTKKQQGRDSDRGFYDDDITDGALTGGTLGGIGGLLLGAGAMAIPGIGPVIAAGPIAAAISGVVAGGIAGGLIDWGIPSEASHRYEESVAQGNTLAVIRSSAGKVNTAAQILRQNGASQVESHAAK